MAEFFSYCSLADVEGRTQLSFGPEDKPSRTEALETVEGVASEIDGVLKAAGYTIPVGQSQTRALRMLRYYNVLGASYQLWDVAYRGTQMVTASKTWRDDYQLFLTRIRQNQQELPGLTTGDSTKFVVSIQSVVTSHDD